MAWPSTPKSPRADSDGMAKQQWQSKRIRAHSGPSPRPVVRGKRGVAMLTCMLLVGVVFLTTASFPPRYTASTVRYGRSATAYGIRKWKEAEEKLMGPWTQYEAAHFPTSNPHTLSATHDRDQDHGRHAQPPGIAEGNSNMAASEPPRPATTNHHVLVVVPDDAQPERNARERTARGRSMRR